MKKSKGFTIIELLVVIAIIAVLAAIVLVNVSRYIGQGKNAAIRGNLATVLTNFAVYYDTAGTYTGFCSTANFLVPQAAIANAGGAASCNVNTGGTEGCACTSLLTTDKDPVGTTFCVDITGAKKSTLTACATECPSGVSSLCL